MPSRKYCARPSSRLGRPSVSGGSCTSSVLARLVPAQPAAVHRATGRACSRPAPGSPRPAALEQARTARLSSLATTGEAARGTRSAGSASRTRAGWSRADRRCPRARRRASRARRRARAAAMNSSHGSACTRASGRSRLRRVLQRGRRSLALDQVRIVHAPPNGRRARGVPDRSGAPAPIARPPATAAGRRPCTSAAPVASIALRALAEQREDLALALAAVADHPAHQLARVVDRRAVRGVIDAVVARRGASRGSPCSRPCRRRAGRRRWSTSPSRGRR